MEVVIQRRKQLLDEYIIIIVVSQNTEKIIHTSQRPPSKYLKTISKQKHKVSNHQVCIG